MTKYLGVGRIQNAEIWNMALYPFEENILLCFRFKLTPTWKMWTEFKEKLKIKWLKLEQKISK